MKRISLVSIAMMVVLSVFLLGNDGCNDSSSSPETTSGVKKYDVEDVQTDEKGRTNEQANIEMKTMEENDPNAIWHVYIISCYSGQVLEHLVAKGKVTSSGKRLTPYAVAAMDGEYVDSDLHGMKVKIGNGWYRTPEVIQDDGTYGHSEPTYLYFKDVLGNTQRIYPQGGIYIRVTKFPIGGVKPVIMNMEVKNVED